MFLLENGLYPLVSLIIVAIIYIIIFRDNIKSSLDDIVENENDKNIDIDKVELIVLRPIGNTVTDFTSKKYFLMEDKDIEKLPYKLDMYHSVIKYARVDDKILDKYGILFDKPIVISGKNYLKLHGIHSSLAFIREYIDIDDVNNIKDDPFFPGDKAQKALVLYKERHIDEWIKVFNFYKENLINNKILETYEEDVIYGRGCNISTMNEAAKKALSFICDLNYPTNKLDVDGKVEYSLNLGYVISFTKEKDEEKNIFSSTVNNDVDFVKSFIEHPNDINIMSDRGIPIIHLAVENNSYEVFKMFLEKNINLNVVNIIGNTPLHQAVDFQRIEMMKDILSIDGINVDAQNKEKHTPLNFATYKGSVEMTKMLLDYGADLKIELDLNMANVSSNIIKLNKKRLEIQNEKFQEEILFWTSLYHQAEAN